MAEPVLTGAIAIVKQNGTVIGRMRNIRATETLRRADVRGLGTILKQEAPIVEHAGTITCDFYEVDFSRTGIVNAIKRDVQTNQEFEDNALLGEEGVTIDVFKKVKDVIDSETGLVRPKLNPYATITRCLIDSEGFDISEGQVAGHNQSFIFLDPILKRS